jgi:hypothetical protein
LGENVFAGFMDRVLLVNADSKNARSAVLIDPELHVVDETFNDLASL